MNNIENTILLPGITFMVEIQLRQLRFTYSTCTPFTRNRKRIQKFKKTGNLRYIYQNELNKIVFIMT